MIKFNVLQNKLLSEFYNWRTQSKQTSDSDRSDISLISSPQHLVFILRIFSFVLMHKFSFASILIWLISELRRAYKNALPLYYFRPFCMSGLYYIETTSWSLRKMNILFFETHEDDWFPFHGQELFIFLNKLLCYAIYHS